MKIVETHHTSTIEILLRSDGIIEIHTLPEMRSTYSIEQMEENVEKLMSFSTTYRNILVVISNGKYSRDARRYLASQEDLADKVAMVAKAPFQKLVGNFFLGVYRPSLNIKLFTDTDKAEKWLLGQ